MPARGIWQITKLGEDDVEAWAKRVKELSDKDLGFAEKFKFDPTDPLGIKFYLSRLRLSNGYSKLLPGLSTNNRLAHRFSVVVRGKDDCMTAKHRILTTRFAAVYPLYVAKAEKKGRKKSEVDTVICWLTGYNQQELEEQLENQKDFETFFKEAPKLNPSRTLIKGVICGVRVEDIQEPTMREIRYLDKLIDELAKGKAMDKILRA